MKMFATALAMAAALGAGGAVSQPAERPAPASPASAAPVDPARLALAQQVLALSGDVQGFDASLEQTWPVLEERLAENPRFRPEWREPFLQAAREEMAAMRPQFIAAAAEMYARRFTAEQLRDYLAFLNTPSGRAIASSQAELAAEAGRMVTRSARA